MSYKDVKDIFELKNIRQILNPSLKFKDDADNKGKELRIKLWIIMNNF